MAQIKLHDQRKPLEWWKLIGRCTVSCISVLLSQLALSLVPRFFSASPLFIQLILSAVSCLMDIAFNGAITMLIIGLCSIMSSNPGLVTYGSSDEIVESSVAEFEAHNRILEPSASVLCHECPTEGSVLGRRVRYCRICKGYIKGFDHHCPAFGNCIVAAKSQMVDRTRLETSLSGNLAISTMLFSIFQLLWQINWKKYPEFQDVVHSQPGQSFNEMRFKNPYDKGILQNVKEFLGF